MAHYSNGGPLTCAQQNSSSFLRRRVFAGANAFGNRTGSWIAIGRPGAFRMLHLKIDLTEDHLLQFFNELHLGFEKSDADMTPEILFVMKDIRQYENP
ncbi:hypothetical protein CEXT_504631 [Caerostris extrusa]|uniref:Uncharacterized protein n=1 Tax=Caerostris extrusa TaxID=172846 RepID=A0AAV4VLF8_CAEEX|nr:hypothetical protein CEXT_504631 [Caerostris extrusa]